MLKKRVCSFVLLIAMMVTLAMPTAAAETAPAREDSAKAAIDYAQKYGGATSIQYALWEDGKITMTGNSGVYSKTENMVLSQDTLYGIGSVSKMYLTAAVMKLAETGKLNLDEKVITYLPEFKMKDARYKNITVRMLLNHSSGLMGSTITNALLFNDVDQTATKDLLKSLSTQSLKAEPGAYSTYCNDGFTLAELVVEKVSAKSFGDFLHEEILKPLGLNNTFIPADQFDTKRLAKIYNGAETRALPQDCLSIVGTGGIYATASDVASFGGALTGTNLLNASSTKAMAADEYKKGMWPADDADLLSFGLGWDNVHSYPFALSNIQGLCKGGDTLQYHAGLVVLPEQKMAVAVLSSGGTSVYNQAAAQRILVDALKAKGIAVDETMPKLAEAKPAPMPKDLVKNSGYYGATTQQMQITIAEDGKLKLHSLTMPSVNQEFGYYSDGSFRDKTGTKMLKFVTEKNGEIYIFQKGCANLPGLGLVPTSNYLCQKMVENKIDAQVQKVWDTFDTNGSVPLSEKYTSQVYLANEDQPAEIPEAVPGYVGSAKIIDATHAKCELQIPGNSGRDSNEIVIYEKDGETYFETTGVVFKSNDKIPNVYASGNSYSTIQADGYARWYFVDSKDAGKTMNVTVPQNGGYYVYDAKNKVVASSVLYGDKSVTLPKGGMIAFVGDVGAKFQLAFANAK